jgi:halocyanin-like protein
MTARSGRDELSRRTALRVTAAGLVTSLVGCLGSADSPAETADFGGWFDDVGNFDGTVDKTGQDTVEIAVGAEGNGGGFAFSPAAVRVSPGTEVVWEWTGEGGAHNVVSEGDGPLDSGSAVSESGTTYSHTFENEGTFKYACTPHKAMGMKGAVVVDAQSGSASGSGDGGGGGDRSGADLSGPEWLLSGSIALAFFSPLLFAAAMRRRYEGNTSETRYATADD